MAKIKDAVRGTRDYSGTNYCDFFRSKLGDILYAGDNDDGKCKDSLEGANGHSFSYTNTVPDVGSNDYSGKVTTKGLTVPNMEPGAKFCIAVGTTKRSSTTNYTVISGSYCTNVVKKPTVHVWGGSVAANGNISTALTSVKPDGGSKERAYASWTDLGIVAGGAVNRMSSGRASVSDTDVNGFKNGAAGNGIPCSLDYSPLTVANTCTNS